MEKVDEIKVIIDRIRTTKEEKYRLVKEQQYDMSAKTRDIEMSLIKKLDDISGVKDFYHKVYTTEEILKHLELITNSTERLRRLRPHFKEQYDDINFDKIYVNLLTQRDEAYEELFKIRSIIK
jgi:hypothetical protein